MTYEDHVLEHFGKPFHKGPPPGVRVFARSFTRTEVGSNCGDEVILAIRILPNGECIDIWWTGNGCCFSQAATSMLAEYFEGRTLDDVRKFTQDDMLKLFKVDVPMARLGCVLVPYNALKHALERIL